MEALNSLEIVVAYVDETLAAGFAEVLFPEAELRAFDDAKEAEAAVVLGWTAPTASLVPG
ncbi:MAG: hypothetical protein AAF844_11665 [Pseudomonadota bacterium]